MNVKSERRMDEIEKESERTGKFSEKMSDSLIEKELQS